VIRDRLERSAAAIPQLARGMVWCTVCGRSQKVDGAGTLTGRVAGGWPKCCSFTMTIDSPEERRILAARNQ
jgi:hypothetical protein